MLRNKKGWIRLIEVALAMLLIFSYLAYIQKIQQTEESESSEWEENLLRVYGQDVLQTLNKKDEDDNSNFEFRTAVATCDTGGINANLTDLLPSNIEYSYQLYYAGSDCTYTPPVIGTQGNIVSVLYFVSEMENVSAISLKLRFKE